MVVPVIADAAWGISLGGAIPAVLLLIALAAIGAIGALSHETDRHFSASLVYLAMGALGALLVRPLGIDPFRLLTGHDTVEILTDVAIAVAVFATGLRLRRELAVLLLLGSALTTSGLEEPGLAGWLLAPLLLLVIRPLAALAALVGSGIVPRERLYVAWFGVKGVAALNYAVVAAAGGLLGADASVVLWTAIACVIVSIAVHGISATAVTRRLLPD